MPASQPTPAQLLKALRGKPPFENGDFDDLVTKAKDQHTSWMKSDVLEATNKLIRTGDLTVTFKLGADAKPGKAHITLPPTRTSWMRLAPYAVAAATVLALGYFGSWGTDLSDSGARLCTTLLLVVGIAARIFKELDVGGKDWTVLKVLDTAPVLAALIVAGATQLGSGDGSGYWTGTGIGLVVVIVLGLVGWGWEKRKRRQL